MCAFPQTAVHHVKSHDDHPMNEFADSVCIAISEGNLNMANFSRNLDFRPHTEAMRWFFLPFLSPEAQLAYPQDTFYYPLSRRLGCSDLEPHKVQWRALPAEQIAGDLDKVDKSCSLAGQLVIKEFKVAAFNSGYIVGDNHQST